MKSLCLVNCALAVVLVVSVQPSMSKPAAKRPAAKPAQSDVVVKKNADGTVEVSDAEAAPEEGQPAPAPTHKVIYKLAPPGTLHYSDGVTVHRNADGSIDVSDEDANVIHPLPGSAAPVQHHGTAHGGKHAVHSSHVKHR